MACSSRKTPLKGAAAGKNTREAMLETSADYRPFFPAVQKGINIEENPGGALHRSPSKNS
jgi:hypothetical protein